MIFLVLFAALTFPQSPGNASTDANAPVAPEQVLAWELEGLTQEEIRDEVRARSLTEYPEIALLSALSAAGADAGTIRVMRATKAPRKLWKLGLRLPKSTDYLYEIAGAILWNDRATAIQVIENEAEKQPGSPDVHLIYAFLAGNTGDWIRAYAEATQAAKLAPEWPYAHGLRSTICYHARLPECAVREAQVFVKLRPEDATAHVALGRALEIEGDFVESLQAYGEAKKLHEGYSSIYEGMGRVYAQTGEFEKAVAAFEQAIQMEKGNAPEYSCELAQLYLAAGYLGKAIETLRRAKEQNPNRVDVLLALGNAYLADKQYSAAIREFREVLEGAPDLEIAREQLAKTLRAAGRSAEAEQVYLDMEKPSFAKQH